jgi:hypothetical protein
LTARRVKLEDTKGVIRIHISKKNRQHYGKEKYKSTNNDLQNINGNRFMPGKKNPIRTI